MSIKLYLAVGTGGMFGALARYGISILGKTIHTFPYATLSVNLIGCFVLSFLLNYPLLKKKLSPEIIAALNVGVIGSFTTFSTFAAETAQLVSSHLFLGIIYLLFSIFGGILFCYFGYKTATGKWVGR